MPKQYKTTFNYVLTHITIPKMVFSDVDLFFETIITTPQNMQLFMQKAINSAARQTENDPDIQPASPVAHFDMFLFGTDGDRGVVVVKIPDCKKECDCYAIAFPTKRENARYFTYELSSDPLTSEQFFIVGELQPEGEQFIHRNYGRVNLDYGQVNNNVDNHGFPRKVAEIVYGETNVGGGAFEMPDKELYCPCGTTNFIYSDMKPPYVCDNCGAPLSEDTLEEEEQDHYEKIHTLAVMGWGAYTDGNFQFALDYFNKILDTEDNSAVYFQCRAEIHRAMGNDYAADYDIFRAKLIDMNNAANGTNDSMTEELEKELGLGKRKPLIETANGLKGVTNGEGELLFCMKTFGSETRMEELFYAGGENALLRRRMDHYVLLEDFSLELQELLKEKDQVLIGEDLPEGGIDHVYKAPVRHVPAADSPDIKEVFREDGYVLLAALAALVRTQIPSGKPIKDIIAKDDLPNLAAVLAREEDYGLLEIYTHEGLPLNQMLSWSFNGWQPTPLYYITTRKVWGCMKDPEKMLRYLAEHGADPNLESAEGETPLGNQCLSRGTAERMKILLDIGADPNLDHELSDGILIKPLLLLLYPDEYDAETHAFKPFTTSTIERVKLLLGSGADTNAKLENGVTPLGLAMTYATGAERRELVTLLCDKGANIVSALRSMEDGGKQNFPEFYYALYEAFAGFPDQEPVPELAPWKNGEAARRYLEISAENGYNPAKELLGLP